jgi:RHS repeat-associated protein
MQQSGTTSPQNRYTFQGQEIQESIGWYQFKWRNHDPTIGRFFNVDPLAEKFYYNSVYAFSENKVTNHIELEGLEAVFAQVELRASAPIVSAAGLTGSGALGVVADPKGNVGIYFTGSGGLQVGGGASIGVTQGVNFNTNDIYGLEGWGTNVGGFFTPEGTGKNFSGEVNVALSPQSDNKEKGFLDQKIDILSVGVSLGSKKYSAGIGGSAYLDVSYTHMIESGNVKDGLENLTEKFTNAFNEAGVSPSDLGIDNVDEFIQSLYQQAYELENHTDDEE